MENLSIYFAILDLGQTIKLSSETIVKLSSDTIVKVSSLFSLQHSLYFFSNNSFTFIFPLFETDDYFGYNYEGKEKLNEYI